MFRRTKAVEVVQRFDETEFDFTRLYSYPEELNLLEVEVWPRAVALAPDRQRTFGVDIMARAENRSTSCPNP